jgi:hypothetical protein
VISEIRRVLAVLVVLLAGCHAGYITAEREADAQAALRCYEQARPVPNNRKGYRFTAGQQTMLSLLPRSLWEQAYGISVWDRMDDLLPCFDRYLSDTGRGGSK